MRFRKIDLEEHAKGAGDERGVRQTGSIDDACEGVQRPEMDDRMRIIDQRHENIDCGFQQWSSGQSSDVTVYGTKCQRTTGSTVGISIVDDLIDEVLDSIRKVICAR